MMNTSARVPDKTHRVLVLYRTAYLILLCTAHHVEEQVYAALVHYSQAFQEGYFIWKAIRGGEALDIIEQHLIIPQDNLRPHTHTHRDIDTDTEISPGDWHTKYKRFETW